MDYFELFGIAPTMSVDKVFLRKKYYELSQQFHPDRHSTMPTEVQQRMMEMATLTNKAYKVLADRWLCAEYLLSQHGMLDEKASLPPAFLAEMMDLNEAVQAIETTHKPEQKQATIDHIYQLLKTSEQGWQQLHEDTTMMLAQKLPVLKDLYLQSRYLQRLKQSAEVAGM